MRQMIFIDTALYSNWLYYNLNWKNINFFKIKTYKWRKFCWLKIANKEVERKGRNWIVFMGKYSLFLFLSEICSTNIVVAKGSYNWGKIHFSLALWWPRNKLQMPIKHKSYNNSYNNNNNNNKGQFCANMNIIVNDI